jgi:hypothetical protein
MTQIGLGYERQPPVGNTLIDDDADSVFIRILPDRTLGRSASWFFAAAGIGVLSFALAQMRWTRTGVLQSLPILFASTLFFLLALTMRYSPRTRATTILASPRGVEFTAGGFSPRWFERATLQRVFTRNAPMSRRMILGMRFVDGADVVLGSGEAKEIEAMARALHRVLNSQISKGGSSSV